jgi:hypothetical protein
VPNYWNVASSITPYPLSCFQRQNVLIHSNRSNWNFGELKQQSKKFRLRVYSNKNFLQSTTSILTHFKIQKNWAAKSAFINTEGISYVGYTFPGGLA